MSPRRNPWLRGPGGPQACCTQGRSKDSDGEALPSALPWVLPPTFAGPPWSWSSASTAVPCPRGPCPQGCLWEGCTVPRGGTAGESTASCRDPKAGTRTEDPLKRGCGAGTGRGGVNWRGGTRTVGAICGPFWGAGDAVEGPLGGGGVGGTPGARGGGRDRDRDRGGARRRSLGGSATCWQRSGTTRPAAVFPQTGIKFRPVPPVPEHGVSVKGLVLSTYLFVCLFPFWHPELRRQTSLYL